MKKFWVIPVAFFGLGLIDLPSPYRAFYMPAVFMILVGLAGLLGYLTCYIGYFHEIDQYDRKHNWIVGWDIGKGYDYTVVILRDNKGNIINYEYPDDAKDCNEE